MTAQILPGDLVTVDYVTGISGATAELRGIVVAMGADPDGTPRYTVRGFDPIDGAPVSLSDTRTTPAQVAPWDSAEARAVVLEIVNVSRSPLALRSMARIPERRAAILEAAR